MTPLRKIAPVAAGLLLGGAWILACLHLLDRTRSADSIRALTNQLRIDLLECRRREKDFLLRSLTDPAFHQKGTTVYLEQHRAELSRLERDAGELAALASPEWRPEIGSLRDRIRRYDEAFAGLVAGHRRRGFESWGIVGERRRILGDLEDSLQTRSDEPLRRELLLLQLEEKNYQLNPGERGISRLSDQVDRLRGALHRNAAAGATEDLGLLNRYLTALNAGYAVEVEIGLHEYLGLQAKFRTAAHEIEPIAARVIDRASDAYAAASRQLVGGLVVASILLAALLSTTFFMTRTAMSRAQDLEAGRKDLTRSNENLTRSNAELQEFAYVASHDLQEPLRAVAGCAEILQQRWTGKLDAKADELITHVVQGSIRMQTLIEDLLTLSRVGTQGRPFESVDAGDALRRALANLEVALRDSGAVMTHDPLPTVSMDPTQLMQVFQNLIGNALKFRSPAPPAIHVGAHRQEGAWRLSVRDNGIGIDPQYFDRIFKVFKRLHTRGEYPGNGIGLAICRKIVERHGGKIGVESGPSQGSTFYFVVPDRSTAS